MKSNKEPKTRTFKVPKMIPIGSKLVCADSSGAKELKVIGYKFTQGADKRRLSGGVGSVAVVVVTKGKTSLKKKTHKALIIRQKFPITRFKGAIVGKVAFRDNAAVLLDTQGKVIKDTIKGPVAKEVLNIKSIYSALSATYR